MMAGEAVEAITRGSTCQDEGGALAARVEAGISALVDEAVRVFAAALADSMGARAVLFYGSNLRTGSLEGVLDFYVLLPGTGESAIWPTVSYHERAYGERTLRAKVAVMRLETFVRAARGNSIDTTIWARFVQPSALVWQRDEAARALVVDALCAAAGTAARLAAALGPPGGKAEDYWRALFRATYEAEFRVEKPGRESDILAVNEGHFAGLLPLALETAGVPVRREEGWLVPRLPQGERRAILAWWRRRRRLGKPLNLLRLVRASATFDGAARYAAWKIERHTGMPVAMTPFREKHPILAAPSVLWSLWRRQNT